MTLRTDRPDQNGSVRTGVECSVVIPYYGTPEATGDLVDRLMLEIRSGSVVGEVIVVDDCSPVPLAARDDVRYLRQTSNQGFGSAVNRGASAASHSVLVVLNSDLRPDDNFLASLLAEAVTAFPAFVSADVRTPERRGGSWDPLSVQSFPSAWDIVAPQVALLNRRSRARAARLPRSVAPGETGRRDGWVGAPAFCIETALFREVGGFDPDFFMYVEDIDLQWRLHERGVPVVLAGVRVEHLGGASSTHEKATRWGTEGYFVYARKRGFLCRMSSLWIAMIGVNFGYDLARRITGRRVTPMGTLVRQLRYLRVGMRAGHRASFTGPPQLAADRP